MTFVGILLYFYVCIYICNHENSVPSWFSLQWLRGNSCTWATVHHVPKCMSCHKAIVAITGRMYCFYDCIYITPILLLWDLSTVCVCRGSFMTTYISLVEFFLKFKTKKFQIFSDFCVRKATEWPKLSINFPNCKKTLLQRKIDKLSQCSFSILY